jgi:para-aminobenzoate synthetase/4-amino-4-deoxychorismate lyase
MTSTVQAETDASLQEIFAALFPPASVTGTPKRRAMEIIYELETEPRQLYTGAIGFVHPNRQMQFNVAIRTVLVDRRTSQLEYGVGGGIVWDSDPNEEFEECLIKANNLEPLDSSFDLIETMRWSADSGCFLLPIHLKRLSESAVYFGFNFDAERVLQSLRKLESSLANETYRVRLSLRRDGNVCFEANFLDESARLFTDVCLAANPIDSNNPMLYHKTSDRGAYERALREAGGGDDVLLFNERGEVTESTIANFAFELDGQLYTPPIECGLLPGIYRAWLIGQGQLKERAISVEDALNLPHIFLMNSVRGLQKVHLHRLAASDR